MCWNERTNLACSPSAPRDARRFSGEVIGASIGAEAWGRAIADDCQLVVSELVTNSVKSGGSAVTITITVHRDWVHLSVYDDGPGMPRLINAGPLATSGRGLAITAAVAQRWGVEAQPPGKQVWVDLAMAGIAEKRQSLWCLEPVAIG